MPSCNFDNGFPLESIKQIIDILRSGEAEKKKWLLVQEAACAVGTAAKMMDERQPIPDDVMGGTPAEVLAAEKLQELVDSEENTELMSGLPWFAIIKILLPIIIDSLGEEAPEQ